MSNDTSDPPKPGLKLPIHDSHGRPEPPQAAGSWSGLTSIVTVVVIFVAALFGGAFLLSLYASLHHWSQAYINEWLNNSVEAQFIYILFDELLTVFLLWLFSRLRHYKHVLKTLGLLRPHFKDLVYVVLGLAVYFGLYIAVAIAASNYTNIDLEQKQDIGFQAVISQRDLVLTFISLVILPPVVEEIMFRGFLFGGLRKGLRFGAAALITSVLFAVPHLLEGQNGKGLLWIAGVDTFILSLVLCYIREKTGRIWAGIGVHALKNGIAFWALFILH